MTTNKNTIPGTDSIIAATDVHDATLNWSGGEHKLQPSGQGDLPFSPSMEQVAGTGGSNNAPSRSALSGVDHIIDSMRDEF